MLCRMRCGLNALLSLGFLLVCLVNAIGLMAGEIRRPFGGVTPFAGRWVHRGWISFCSALAETTVVGALGGALGLTLTVSGLAEQRAMLKSVTAYTGQLTHLDSNLMALTLSLAVGAALLAGLYPAWRAARVSLSWQLKEQ